jgi:hypothetical protein
LRDRCLRRQAAAGKADDDAAASVRAQANGAPIAAGHPIANTRGPLAAEGNRFALEDAVETRRDRAVRPLSTPMSGFGQRGRKDTLRHP